MALCEQIGVRRPDYFLYVILTPRGSMIAACGSGASGGSLEL